MAQSRNLPYYIVDVFGQDKYTGNQLAVFSEAKQISSDEMALIARETNYSETTFITGVDLENFKVTTRIFTPAGEIPFAGHPTLGTAYMANMLFWQGKAKKVTLDLKVGEVPVIIDSKGLWMTQIQPEFGDEISHDTMAKALGLPLEYLNLQFPVVPVSTGLNFYIAAVKSLDALKQITVNPQRILESLEGCPTKGVLVFSGEGYCKEEQLASRVFVPAFGIPEDPATGSATGCLAAYLLKHNVFNTNEIELSIGQGYEMMRPSRLHIKANYSNDHYNINVGGNVVEIAIGYWM